MKYTEVEQKFSVKNKALLISALERDGVKRLGEYRQIDTYFNAPDRDFLGEEIVSEWFRLRETKNGATINFKKWLPIDSIDKTHCDEFESEISDQQAITHILHALNFVELIKVDKLREQWNYDDTIEIDVDTVEGLGTFVEFEYKGDAESVEAATKALQTFIKSLDLNLGERDKRGYPYLLLAQQGLLESGKLQSAANR